MSIEEKKPDGILYYVKGITIFIVVLFSFFWAVDKLKPAFISIAGNVAASMMSKTYTLGVVSDPSNLNVEKYINGFNSVEGCADKARDISEDLNDFNMQTGRYVCYTYKEDVKSRAKTGPVLETSRITLRDGKLHIRKIRNPIPE